MTASAQPSSADAEPLGPDRICAVIVTFYPDADVVAAEIAACREQVQTVVVVDNSPDLPWFHPPVHGDSVVYLPQAGNVGLAAAQNAGIAHARATGHTHVLMLDQDSVPAPGMVAALSCGGAWSELGVRRPGGSLPSGPASATARGQRRAVRPGRLPDEPQAVVRRLGAATSACDFLISSGALIPLAVLDDVGAMDEGLFIDNVDLEWSFRARARGYAPLRGVRGDDGAPARRRPACRCSAAARGRPARPGAAVLHHAQPASRCIAGRTPRGCGSPRTCPASRSSS